MIGGNPGFEQLLGMDPIPEVPIDPAVAVARPGGRRGVRRRRARLPRAVQARDPAGAVRRDRGDRGRAELGSLPPLWIHGELDQLAPLEVTRPGVEKIRGDVLEEHVYEGAQHEIFNETNQDEVIERVAAFLDRR